MAKILELRVAPPGDALDRFEAAWNRVAEGSKVSPLRILSLKTLTPARWTLVENLRREGSVSIYGLAKRVGRDYKNVHTDVTALTETGLVRKNAEGEIEVAWDVLRAELRL